MNKSVSDGASTSTSRNDNSNHFVISQSRRGTEESAGNNAAPANGNQETSDESEYEERLLVVNCRSGKLGAAYYTLQTGELFVTEEIVDRAPPHAALCSLLRQVDPVRLVTDGSQPAAAALHAVTAAGLAHGGDGQRCKLVTVSAREYNFEACKRRIHSLSLPSEPRDCSDQERLVYLRTAIDFSQSRTVHALGTLLRYLDLHWAGLTMDTGVHSKPQFLRLRKVSLADIVTIDWDTYLGLQVFSPRSHPSGFRRGERERERGAGSEGLSLLRLFSRTCSGVGGARLRVLMQQPSRDQSLLTRRQEVIAHFLRPASEPLVKNLTASLRHIRNVNTLYNAVLICELCQSGPAPSLLRQLAAFPAAPLHRAALAMQRLIDFDLCAADGKFTVRAGVDPELDTKKQTMASLHSLMSNTARAELSRLPDYIQECSMVYLPHLGYLLAVRAWTQNLTAQEKDLPDMRFMNNDYIHYKSKGCEELDVMIGDTYPEIVAHETRIMMQLTSLLKENLHTLADLIDKCADLDCLIAMSKVAKEFNYVCPTLTSDKVVWIEQGRHPLHQLSCDAFVPNDYRSDLSHGLAKVITGPNASGKSVYIKQIGVIVYLAHIGSFVPAAAATVGLLAALHSRLHHGESVAAHMSAFLIDLRQMSLALQQSGSAALLLVDEFGKGSCAADGAALLAAAANSLLCRRRRCPHLVLATHFRNISHLLLDTPILRFMRFEYMLQPGSPVPVFLFRATEAASDSASASDRSLALAVAQGCGLPTDVIRRAQTLLASLATNTVPPVNERITAKLKSCTEIITNELLTEDI